MSDIIMLKVKPERPKIVEKQEIVVHVNPIDVASSKHFVNSINIENGAGASSVQQKGFVYDGENIIFSNGTKGTQNGDVIPGAKATGKQSIAFGGLRYDYYTNPETLAHNLTIDSTATEHWGRTPTSAEGVQSFAAGGSVHAYGDWAVAMGKDNKAYNKGDIALGGGNIAGNSTQAPNSDSYAIALGDSNTAKNRGSVAIGGSNETTYAYAVAAGYGNKASGHSSVTLGNENTASGPYSVAMGKNSEATAQASIAVGLYAKSKADESIALGAYTEATGAKSIAAGDTTKAKSWSSVALGIRSEANGWGSAAIGVDALTQGGIASVALGQGVKASNVQAQAVIGRYNEEDADAIFIVGNGTNEDNRSNAFEVLKDGRAKVQSAPVDDDDVVRKVDLADIIADIDTSNFVTTNTNQLIQGIKKFQPSSTSDVFELNGNSASLHSTNGRYGVNIYTDMVEVYDKASLAKYSQLMLDGYYLGNENGTLSISADRMTVNDNDILYPSQAGTLALKTDIPDIDTSNLVTLDGEQQIGGAKRFTSTFTVETVWNRYVWIEDGLVYYTYIDDNGYFNIYTISPFGVGGQVYDDDGNYSTYSLKFPKKSGTLATTDDVKKYYAHRVDIGSTGVTIGIRVTIISSHPTAVTNYAELYDMMLNANQTTFHGYDSTRAKWASYEFDANGAVDYTDFIVVDQSTIAVYDSVTEI